VPNKATENLSNQGRKPSYSTHHWTSYITWCTT